MGAHKSVDSLGTTEGGIRFAILGSATPQFHSSFQVTQRSGQVRPKLFRRS